MRFVFGLTKFGSVYYICTSIMSPFWAPTERHATVVQYAGNFGQKGVNPVLILSGDLVHRGLSILYLVYGMLVFVKW